MGGPALRAAEDGSSGRKYQAGVVETDEASDGESCLNAVANESIAPCQCDPIAPQESTPLSAPVGHNGAGLGASHQTGWTGIVARMTHLFATTTPEQIMELGKLATTVEVEHEVHA